MTDFLSSIKGLSLSLALIFSSLIFAQNPEAVAYVQARTDIQKLQTLSAQFAREAKRAKAEAWEQARLKGWPTRQILPDGTLIELDHLLPNGQPMYLTTYNANAAISTQTNQLHNGGALGLNLEGQSMVIGEWDGGAVRATHEQLSGRVIQQDGATSLSNHATHVAGTLIGDGTPVASAKGMAPQATLWAYDWSNDDAEMAAAAANGLLVSNHSYGFATGWSSGPRWWGDTAYSFKEDVGFGLYSSPAISWDQIAEAAPYYLIVKSAGNDRNDAPPSNGTDYEYRTSGTLFSYDSSDPTRSPEQDGGSDGYDCISWAGNAKNILTVGAVDDVLSYSGAGDVGMSSFSGWGPTDDGRIKPDLVANGVGLYSSLAGSDSQYASYSGTSMSGPNLAASLILLQQFYQENYNNASLRASSLKGLAIHTAREAGPAVGPDYAYGWGLLSMADAVQVLQDNLIHPQILREDTLRQSETQNFTFQAKGNEPLRITLCYTDVPGGTNFNINDRSARLVNDLDISLSSGASTYFPYKLDVNNPAAAATTGDNDVDNVEQIYLASPTAGQSYTLTLNHEGALDGGINGEQIYSLIVTGAQGDFYTVSNCSSGCDPSDLNSWNSKRDGTGFAPGSFDQGTRWIVQGGHQLNSAADWSLSNPYSTLVVESTAQVQINSGHTFTLRGPIQNEGDFYIANAASLVQRDNERANSGGGSYYITRNSGTLLDNRRYNFWSSPVSSVSLSTVFSNANPNDFYLLNESTQQFTAVSDPSQPMIVGRGYTATLDQNNTGSNINEDRTFTGTVNNGDLSIALSWSPNDFALIGNPYPSAISSSQFLSDNPNLADAIYFFNHGNNPNPSSADYAIWNALGSTSGNGETPPTEYIGTAQGVLVQASSSVAPSQVEFKNAQRTAGNNAQFFKGNTQQRLWLNLEHGADFQQILLGFSPQASKGFDAWADAIKYKGNPELSFYSRGAGRELGIQGRPQVAQDSISLGVETTLSGSFTISLDSLSNWPAGTNIYLEDRPIGKWTDLQAGDYTFTASPADSLSYRFFLHLGITNVGLEESPALTFHYAREGNSLRWFAEDVADLQILDLSGKQVLRASREDIEQQTLSATALKKGIYLLKASWADGSAKTIKFYW